MKTELNNITIEELEKALEAKKAEAVKEPETLKEFDDEEFTAPQIPFVVFDKPKEIIGKLVDIGEVEGQFGPQARYEIETSKGLVAVYGSKALDSGLRRIKLGEEIKITYKGEQVSRAGFTYKNFEVLKKRHTGQ